MKKLVFLLFVLLIIGCTMQTTTENSIQDTTVQTQPETQEQEEEEEIVDEITSCINLCLQALEDGMDLSNGPCLSNDYYPDYVCDVAHNPRQTIDNNIANQCSEYWVSAFHYVEVDENCEYIISD